MLTHKIIVVDSAPSNAVRAHEHPILEAGNISFPDARYELEFGEQDNQMSYSLTHKIIGAPLITDLLEKGDARYACIVSSPVSSFRKTYTSQNPKHEIHWNNQDFGEPPLFTPLIVFWNEEKSITLKADRDGVHRIWDRQTVTLHKGSRLALGSVIELNSSLLQLLTLVADPSLNSGQFVVDFESEPFRFQVKIHPDLHKFLQHRKDAHRNNIMTHIVSACFARLQQANANDDDLRSQRGLQALSEHLESKGFEDWTDDDFRPEKVASALYPLKLPNSTMEACD